MYYKVIKDNKVIDVLDDPVYLKYQSKNKIMLLSDLKNAQAILSSDNDTIWHEITLHKLPDDAPKYDVVKLVEISEFEYKQLRVLNMKSPEQILDEYNLLLLEMGII